MIAYASAYLKCHYLAAFTAALLNNQPMGFYHSSILIKDAQRHGLRVLPVDVTKSDWLCTLGGQASTPAAGLQTRHLRLGFRYVRGMRQPVAEAIVRARASRPFTSVDDLALRVPELRKDEMKMLAEVGALNPLQQIHRRDALWMAERVVRPVGPLLERMEAAEGASPLQRMTVEERLTSDFRGTGVTIGRHPMAYRRAEMQALGVTPAAYLARVPNGRLVRIAGSVIVRQRPGTAKGFVFLSMEDETGVMNAIITPATYDRYKLVVVGEPFLLIDGVLQNQDGVISVKVGRVEALRAGAAAESHNFH
jgi:error-prone DNA polymerase